MRSIVYKLGGIGCLILLALILYFSKPSNLQGWALTIVSIPFLGSLGVIGVFGARLGTLPYKIAGFMFLGLAGFFVISSIYGLLVGGLGETPVETAFLSIAIFCLGTIVAGLVLIYKAQTLAMSDYLLRFWKADAILTIDEAQKILIDGEKAKPEGAAMIAKDVLQLLCERRQIQQMTPDSWKRIPK